MGDLGNLAARERLVRLGLAETALTTLAGEGSQGANREVFEQALGDARGLEGPPRSEWLGEARGLPLGAAPLRRRVGSPSRPAILASELTALSAIVAVRAAGRAPGMRDRIYGQLLPTSQVL